MWDKTIGPKMGTDTDIWPLSSGPDLKSCLLSTSNFTTSAGATVVPMYFNDVLNEVGWSFIGINADPTY